MRIKAYAVWLGRWVWPILAVIIFVLEMYALFNSEAGDTISEWIDSFPFLLWLPVFILFLWLPLHFWWNRRNKDS